MIIAALVRKGPVRELLLARPGSFVTAEFCIREVWEHREEWGKGRVSDEELMEELTLMAQSILVVVPERDYSPNEREAASLTSDPDDAPVIALALSMGNDGLWTFNTKDFSSVRLKEKVRVLGTREVRGLLGE